MCGYRLRIEVVAARSATVSRGEQDGDTLRRCLLPERFVKRVPRGPETGFTGSKAVAHHRRDIVIDDVKSREVDARRGLGVFRHHDIYRRLRGHHPRYLHIEVGFAFVRIQTGIRPSRNDVGRIGWKAEQGSKIGHVLRINV